MDLSQVTGSSQGSVVDGLKALYVKLLGFRGVEWQSESKECVSKTLNTNGNRSVREVTLFGLRNWVVVDVDDLVKVAYDDLSDLMKFAKVILAPSSINEGWERQGGQVADSNLIWSSVFDDLSAEVRASNNAQILLVALAVAGIFVQHEGVAGLGLSFNDVVPQLLSLDCLSSTTLLLIPNEIILAPE